MADLTNYLEDLTLTDVPKHSTLTSIKVPACTNKLVPKSTCGGCPMSASHPTYKKMDVLAPLPSENRVKPSTLRKIQYAVNRVYRLITGIYGSQTGFIMNGSAATNFAESVTLKVIEANGNHLDVTLQDGSAPTTILKSIARVPVEFAFYKLTLGGFGTLEPGMWLEPIYPSAMYSTARPTIVQIEQLDGNVLRLKTDIDVSNLMHSADATNPDPAEYNVKAWWYADSERWLNIVDPAHHLVVRKTINILPADVPTDGRIQLEETSIAVPTITPVDDDDTSYTFKATAYFNDDTKADWSTVLNGGGDTNNSRVAIVPTGDDTYETWLSLKEYDWDNVEREGWTDLTLTPNLVSIGITYFRQGTETEIALRVAKPALTGNRCGNFIHDYSESADNYGASDGTCVVNSSCHAYCLRRREYVSEQVDTDDDGLPDDIVYTPIKPTGVERFAKGGCLAYGSCNSFTEISAQSVGTKPFSILKSWSRFLTDIWATVSIRVRQLMVGYPYMQIDRVKHTSIAELCGHSLGLTTPFGMRESTYFPHFGLGVGSMSVVTDEDNNESIQVNSGYAWDSNHDYTTGAPGYGYIPDEVDEFTSTLDRIASLTNVTGGIDHTSSMRAHIDRLPVRLEKDTGDQILTRPQDYYSRVVHADEPVFCERLPIALIDEVTDRGDTTFQRLSTPLTIMGNEYTGVLTVTPIIGHEQEPYEPGITGTVYSITQDGNYWTIELDNETNYFSYVDGPSGARYDKIIEFKCGGHFVDAADWQRIQSYYSVNKSLGNVISRCTRGDSVRFSIPDELSGVTGFSNKTFLVTDAEAFAGSAATSFGPSYEIRGFVTSGYFQASLSNTTIGTDETHTYGDPDNGWAVYGNVQSSRGRASTGYSDVATSITFSLNFAVGTNAVLKCLRTNEYILVSAYDEGTKTATVTRGYAGSTAAAILSGDKFDLELVRDGTTIYTRLTGETRPATIDATEYWVDTASNRFYFNEADKSTTVTVNYHVAGKDSVPANYYTESCVIGANTTGGYTSNNAAWDTGLNYDDWNGLPLTVLNDGVALTYTAGTPDADQYTKYDNGNLVLLFNLADAGKPLRARWETEGDVDFEELEVSYIPDFTDWGKNRDKIVIYDESGYVELYESLIAGSTINLMWNASVYYPLSVTLSWARYGTDSWNVISASDFISEHGSGLILIKKSVMDSIVATCNANSWDNICFKM